MSEKTAIERIGAFDKFGIVLGMDRIKELLARLGDPQKGLKVIHVAGTNGKGSVCRYMYEVLEENGYRIGLYTSPYIEQFEERIEFDHELIGTKDLEKYTDKVVTAADDMKASGIESPTEFEVVTAIAFCYFKDKSPDFVILEVGLGGSGDSTNIIENPLVSIITSIGFDHMDRLGNTLAEIAREKAGIIKSGAPIVSNVPEREAAVEIARKAYSVGTVLHDVSKVKWYKQDNAGTGSIFTAFIEGEEFRDIEISMAGDHQIENAVTALAAIEILRKSSIISIDSAKLREGLKKARQKGRFEVVSGREKYILDGAHNAEGMEALVKTIDDYYYGKRVLVLMGVLADKAVSDIVDLAQHMADEFIITEPPNPRKLEANELAAKFEAFGKKCHVEPDYAKALALAESMEEDFDVILCAGSLYLIGKLRSILYGDN